ncbi:hypothetical protein [Galbibacter mesophilus]|uniref:hypothetical protein n=1 Tax=Galbibacter mesophilus TaxID=379069 RepID=UPI00191F8246|nr:hypothetical protein [Galbibacter mesophilus]MCM5663575.1 hypothetical protein [Galbibacter mesophilus]
MKKLILVILVITFTSCSPFEEKGVLDYKAELTDLTSKLNDYDNGIFDRDSMDEFIIEEVRNLNIDLIIKNIGQKNLSYSGFVEESDSLVIFVNRSGSIFKTEKRIIYDFNKRPRNFGNDTIVGASYRIVQLDERWYYSEIGFD